MAGGDLACPSGSKQGGATRTVRGGGRVRVCLGDNLTRVVVKEKLPAKDIAYRVRRCGVYHSADPEGLGLGWTARRWEGRGTCGLDNDVCLASTVRVHVNRVHYGRVGGMNGRG